MKAICLLVSILCLSSQKTIAQEKKSETVRDFTVKASERKRFYLGNGTDLAMLSTAFVSKHGSAIKPTTLRFTAVVNFGFTFNYDFNKRVGLLSGIGIRNMGFIEKERDSTIKRSVYSLGVPLGFKIGDLRNRNFFFAGGGIDIPFHYREKGFIQRNDKKVLGEWFSERTPRIMPFIFAGYSFDPGITLKLQYYPGNFLNTDYDPNYAMPYAGYKVHLLLLSVGIDIHYNQYKIQEREYQEMKKEREQKKLL